MIYFHLVPIKIDKDERARELGQLSIRVMPPAAVWINVMHWRSLSLEFKFYEKCIMIKNV